MVKNFVINSQWIIISFPEKFPYIYLYIIQSSFINIHQIQYQSIQEKRVRT